MTKEIELITILPGLNKLSDKENFKEINIKKGEIIAIVGPTGAGKSQFLYDLERLAQGDTKSKRKILINSEIPEEDWKSNPKKKLIASLAQSMNFLTDLSVKDFLSLHLKARGENSSPKIIKEVVNEANQITGEPINAKMNLLDLSGGQSRALMISDVANISISPVILIDEIENAGIKKEKAIDVLIKEGKIVLIVTHDPSLALKADKRIVVNNGGVVKIIQTTAEEKYMVNQLNQVESCVLEIRDQIREGKKLKQTELFNKN